MIPITITPGAITLTGRLSPLPAGSGADDRCAGGDEDEEERAPRLREQAPPLEAIVEERRQIVIHGFDDFSRDGARLSGVTKVTWKNDPDDHDYPAAAAYLSLLTSRATSSTGSSPS